MTAKIPRVLVCCATTVATSTVMADRVKRVAHKAGIKVEIYKCMGSELKSKLAIHRPDFIVSSLQISQDIGVTVLNGLPYISGVGAEELDRKVVEMLEELTN